MQKPRTSRMMTLALALATMGSVATLGTATQARGEAPATCDALPDSLSGAPFSAEGLAVVQTRNLYRLQQRPHARLPHGAAIVVEAPPGVTAADLQRAVACSAHNDDGVSPAAIDDARIEVRRAGSRYVIEVTSTTRSHALEIQRRAAALR